MVKTIGNAAPYVGGTQGIELPRHDDTGVRRDHTPAKPKPTGLNWDALTPICKGCGQRSGQLGAGELCPPCRGVNPTKPKKTRRTAYGAVELPEDELLRRFTGPDDTQLGRALADLEATDPDVAAAAGALNDAAARLTRPDDHIQAPKDPHKAGNQGRPTTRSSAPRATSPSSDPGSAPGAGSAAHQEKNPAAAQEMRPDAAAGLPDNVTELPLPYSDAANLDAQIQHAERVLRATAGSDDHVVRLLRLNVLSAIEALHLYTQLHTPRHTQTPAPVTSTPAGAGQTTPQTSVEPNPPGLGGAGRPAARTEGEAVARPASTTSAPRRRVMDTDEARRQRRRGGSHVDVDRIVTLYTDGKTIKQVHEETGYATATIRRHLIDRGIPLRKRGPIAGTQQREYDEQLIADVRRLYVDEELTQAQVGERLGIGVKVVQTVMARAEIPARPPANVRSMAGIGHPTKIQPDQHQLIVDRYTAGEPATVIAADYDVNPASIYPILERHGIARHGRRVAPGIDTLGRLRKALAAADATSRQVKDWALAQGLITSISRGLPALGLVEAYAAAHPTPAASDSTGDTTA